MKVVVQDLMLADAEIVYDSDKDHGMLVVLAAGMQVRLREQDGRLEVNCLAVKRPATRLNVTPQAANAVHLWMADND